MEDREPGMAGDEDSTEQSLRESLNTTSPLEEKSYEPRYTRLRPTRILKMPQHLSKNYNLSYFSMDVDEPTTFEVAMESKFVFQWDKAIDKEIEALIENNT